MQFPSKDVAQSLLHTIQALALVAGGCWFAFRYFAHESDATKLSLAQQKLTAEQSALGLRIAESQIELQRLTQEKLRDDIAYSGQYRLERTSELTARKRRKLYGGFSEYDVSFSVRFTNRATKIVEISAYVIDLYIGTPVSVEPSSATVRRFNIPNLRNFTLHPEFDDAIKWRHVRTVGGLYQNIERIYKSAERPHWSYKPPVAFQLNTLGTGPLKHDESTWFTEQYFITARPGDYVVAFMAFCVNNCKPGPEGFTQWDVAIFGDVDTHKESSTDSVKNPPRADVP